MKRALALLVLIACSGPPKRVGTEPSWRTGSGTTATTPTPAGPVTFAPGAQPATRYNEPITPPPHTALNDAVIAAVSDAAKKANKAPPIADGRLFRACGELAEVVPEQGVISYGLVEFALQRNGIVEPSPHLLVLWGDLDQPQAIIDQLAPRFAEMFADGATSRVGIGAVKRAADGSGAIVFALQGSGVTTAPIPRSVALGGSFTIDATIDAHYKDPEVFITRDDGTTQRIEPHATKNAFVTSVQCPTKGRQQVEITWIDPESGSTVLANFPVWCGMEPPVTITVEPSRDDEPIPTREEAEERLLGLVNRERAASGLPALVADEAVRAVSRAHSEEMRRTKVVAHVSPTTGSAADRVRAAKIKTAVVLENVARAYGIGEAHLGLMNSPGHRANIMSRQATNVGIGVVFGEEVSGRKEIFITQVFTRVPPKLELEAGIKLLASKLDTVHKSAIAPKLAAIAQDAATQLASGKTREQIWPSVRQKVDALGGSYAKVGSVVTAAADLEALEGKQLLGDYRPDEIGIGLAQGPHPEIGDGAVWIVILLGSKR